MTDPFGRTSPLGLVNLSLHVRDGIQTPEAALVSSRRLSARHHHFFTSFAPPVLRGESSHILIR